MGPSIHKQATQESFEFVKGVVQDSEPLFNNQSLFLQATNSFQIK